MDHTNTSPNPPLATFADEPQPKAAPLDPHAVSKPAHNKQNMWDKLQDRLSFLKREDGSDELPESSAGTNSVDGTRSRSLGRRTNGRKVVPGLPRPITFRRQNSEKRDRLLPVDPSREKDSLRTRSVQRFRSLSKRSLSPPPPILSPSISAPDVATLDDLVDSGNVIDDDEPQPHTQDGPLLGNDVEKLPKRDHIPPPAMTEDNTDHDSISEGIDEAQLQQELEAKWILNLSMHFRDMSDREKFFITFAETPNKWRRVTVSCDYRNLGPDSLEADLKSLHYQRDKSSRIYESIRDSLPDIQFYETVTNLKLQTDDGRLHVHVTEDVNEIIQYPPVSAVEHLDGPRFSESLVNFESHISGFVYKVSVKGRIYIKKEIPGPDTVEEFLYEVNALHKLRNSCSVIQFEGLITDDKGERVMGLLLSYAQQGAMVDIVFDCKDTESLPWGRRERWARQIVQGLSEIHEAGYVQGDFTLSNIVVDANDDAKIIDINRRGCPVGWEPPELSELIQRNQRISIYIGVKSDIFQLGMVLWALLAQQDEPERQERPLTIHNLGFEAPSYYSRILKAALSETPEERPSAKELFEWFPKHERDHFARPLGASRHSLSTHRSDKEYIDPSTAVNLEDIRRVEDIRRGRTLGFSPADDVIYADGGTNRTSTSYRHDGSSAYSFIQRSVSPTSASALTSLSRRPLDFSPDPNKPVEIKSGAKSLSLSDEQEELNWEKIDLDTDTKAEHINSAVDERDGDNPATALAEPFRDVDVSETEDFVASRAHQTPEKTRTGQDLSDDTPKASTYVSFPLPDDDRDDRDPFDAQHTTTQQQFFTQNLPLEHPMTSIDESAPNTSSSNPDRKVSLELQALSRAWEGEFDAPPRSRGSGSSGSFHDRVHNRRSQDSHLAALEDEVLSAPTPAPPTQRRDSRPFPPPAHHDSGFHEPNYTSTAISDSPISWEDKAKLHRVESLKRLEEREERRRLSAEMDEKRVREEIQQVLRSVESKTKVDGGEGVE